MGFTDCFYQVSIKGFWIFRTSMRLLQNHKISQLFKFVGNFYSKWFLFADLFLSTDISLLGILDYFIFAAKQSTYYEMHLFVSISNMIQY